MSEAPAYHKCCWLFARVLAIVFFGAFASLAAQIRGLLGANGISPATVFLGALHKEYGTLVYRTLPTIFWINSTDAALLTVCIAGAVISLVLLFGIQERLALILLFTLYLSLFSVGQAFLSFQWDLLLLFRLRFESGIIKLLSHDPTWRNFTAMTFHYLTQPLPTRFAWYLYHAPLWFQKFSTAFVFFVELIMPFLIFSRRRMRHVAAAFLIALQTLILLTGNYAFFNVLTIALCLFLLDDSALRWVRAPAARPANVWVTAVLFPGVMLFSGMRMGEMFGAPMPTFVRSSLAAIAPELVRSVSRQAAEVRPRGVVRIPLHRFRQAKRYRRMVDARVTRRILPSGIAQWGRKLVDSPSIWA